MKPQNKLRADMAQKFLDALERHQLPWKACWQNARPENAITGMPYRGVNALFLSYWAGELGYEDSRWCTYNQAQEKGWQVRKGEHGQKVEYWAYFDLKEKKLLSWSDAKKLLKADPDYEKNLQLRSRVYTVFNAEQIDGMPPMERNHTDIGALRGQRNRLLWNMELSYREEGSKAFYSPQTDMVTLPPESSFDDTYSYMSTFLHECAHATGHETRLNRDLSGGFGSESYAKEELRAEIASAFTAQAVGLCLTDEQLDSHMERHLAYVQSWAACLKEAPEELFRAIKDAEGISDYLISRGKFEKVVERDMPVPIGRIDYLGFGGIVGESIEYTSVPQFIKDIEEQNYCGVPMSIVLYQDENGKTISKDFIYDMDPPPQGFEIVDFPYFKNNRIGEPLPILEEAAPGEKEPPQELEIALDAEPDYDLEL